MHVISTNSTWTVFRFASSNFFFEMFHDIMFFSSSGIKFQIIGPKYLIVSLFNTTLRIVRKNQLAVRYVLANFFLVNWNNIKLFLSLMRTTPFKASIKHAVCSVKCFKLFYLITITFSNHNIITTTKNMRNCLILDFIKQARRSQGRHASLNMKLSIEKVRLVRNQLESFRISSFEIRRFHEDTKKSKKSRSLLTQRTDQNFTSKYLKRTFEKSSREIGSIKYGSGKKHLLNTVLQVQYFACKYLKWNLVETSQEIGSIKYLADMKYLLNRVQQEA